MANEIQIDFSLKASRATVASGNAFETATRASWVESFSTNQAGKRTSRQLINVGSNPASLTAVSISGVGTPGWGVIANSDTNSGNTLMICFDNNSAHRYLSLSPGESTPIRLGPDATGGFYMYFLTVASQAEILVLEL